MSAFHRLDRAFGAFCHALGNLIGIIIGLFALTIVVDLVMRLAGLGSLPGMQEIIEYFLFAGVFLGAPWVLRLGAHVRVDLIASAINGTGAGRVIDRLLDLAGLLVCLVMLYYGLEAAAEAIAFEAMQRKTFAMPEWVLIGIFDLSFLMLSVEFLFRLCRGAAPEAEDAAGHAPDAAGQDAGGF